MLLAAACALCLVHLFETGWANRPPATAERWTKGRATRFMWAAAGILVLLGQIPVGILLVMGGLPVCLAHVRLVDRNPATRIGVGAVLGTISHAAQASFRRFMERTRVSPRR
jgi:hypothetical protein